MTCVLDKYTNYDLTSVKHDLSIGKYIVTLKAPPSTCKEGQWVGKATNDIDGKLQNGLLTYSTALNHPVILVPNKSLITDINPPTHDYIGALLLFGLIGFAFVFKWTSNRKQQKELQAKIKAREFSNKCERDYQASNPVTITRTYGYNLERGTVGHHNGAVQEYYYSGPSSGFVSNVASSAIGSAMGNVIANELLDHHPSHSNSSSTNHNEESNYSNTSSSYSSDNSSYSSDNSSYSSDNSSYSSDSSSYSSDDSSYSSDDSRF